MTAVTLRVEPGLPLVGKLFEFRRDRLGFQMRMADAGITRTRVANRTVYIITDADLAHEVLVEHEDAFIKGPGLAVVAKPLLGDGLLTAEKDFHRRSRKLLAPAFTPRRMAGYAAVMAERAAAHAAEVRPGAMLDIAERMMTTTLDIVGRTLFDADLAGDARAVGDALTDAMEYILKAVLSAIPIGWPTPGRRRGLAAVARLDDVVLRVIADRRAAGGDRGDVLSILLQAKDDDGTGLSDQHLRDEIMTLMLAGHETTANLLAWVWYVLATQPAARARLDAELDGVLAGRAPTYDDLPRLPVAMAILEETLRLYPPAHTIARQADRDVEIGGVAIAAGSIVTISVVAMQRRAAYFDDPLTFQLDRFLGGDRKTRRPGYLPFGAGPRVCIGNHFALVEAQLILATWAQRFQFRLAQPAPIEMEPLMTLRPKGGVWVEPRGR
ncbi:MAG: cytochrome P450 [Myxococcales bacterium]|nr:cytochrome P450 [Myxococcales bacterium]